MYSQYPNTYYNCAGITGRDARVNDLHIDGDVFPPFTGATGPAGNSFDGQGFSVVLISDQSLGVLNSLVLYDGVDAARGGYNNLGWFNLGTSRATIGATGTYSVTATVLFSHDFNITTFPVIVRVYKGNPTGDVLAYSQILYPDFYNDEITLIASNIVKLATGDSISVYIQVAVDANQMVLSPFTTFSCQRIA